MQRKTSLAKRAAEAQGIERKSPRIHIDSQQVRVTNPHPNGRLSFGNLSPLAWIGRRLSSYPHLPLFEIRRKPVMLTYWNYKQVSARKTNGLPNCWIQATCPTPEDEEYLQKLYKCPIISLTTFETRTNAHATTTTKAGCSSSSAFSIKKKNKVALQ